MDKILVIGGAGYVGSVLCKILLSSNYKVHCVDSLAYGNGHGAVSNIGSPNYSFQRADLRDLKALEPILLEYDHVIILAGLVGDPITKKFPELSKNINYDGIKKLIDSLNGKKLSRVIFVSTCSNYGLIEDGKLADEETTLSPLSLYAEAKVAAEKHLLGKKGKVDYTPTILRFATAFGISPRMRFDLTISEFTRQLVLGEELLVYDPDTWRPYCHVNDFAELIKQVLSAETSLVDFQVFNAGGDVNNATKRDIVELIIQYCPSARVNYQEKGSDPRNYRVSFEKVYDVLGFLPTKTIEDGILELKNACEEGLFSESGFAENQYGNYDLGHYNE